MNDKSTQTCIATIEAVVQAHLAAGEQVQDVRAQNELAAPPKMRDLGLIHAVLMTEGETQASCTFGGQRDGTPVVNVLVQLSGSTSCAQNGYETVLEAGQAAARLLPSRYSRRSSGLVRKMSLTIPRALIEDVTAALPKDLETTVVATDTNGRTFLGFVEALADEFDNITLSSSAYGTALTDAFRASLSSAVPAGECKFSLLSKAKRMIEEEFRNPTLTIAGIAKSLSCDPRTLTKAFAREDTAPSQFISALRLRYARSLLRERKRIQVSIGRIAILSGFNDPAYFSRLYKRKFGVTPGEVEDLDSCVVRVTTPWLCHEDGGVASATTEKKTVGHRS